MTSSVRSRPIDPNRRSFLKWPAEMRNQVYAILFQRDGLLFLHNIDAFFLPKPDQAEYNTPFHRDCSGEDSTAEERCESNACYSCCLVLWEQVTERDEEEARQMAEEFDYRFSGGLGLLCSCRQVHREAAGVFYADNTFAFTRATSRHFLHFAEHDGNEEQSGLSYANYEYNQVSYAASWLSSIGNNYSFLRKVIIDVDAMCPPDCLQRDWHVFLPLVQVVWAHQQARCEIQFGHTGRFLDPALHPSQDGAIASDETVSDKSLEIKKDMETMASCYMGCLNAIGKEDVLDLKRHSHMLAYIVIDELQGRGHVEFLNQDPWRLRDFTILNNGEKIAWVMPKLPSPGGNLPWKAS